MGIGLECAKAYAKEGAIVVIAAYPSAHVEEAINLLGPKHLGITCDVSSSIQVENAIKKTLEKYGRINAIHNNAGIAYDYYLIKHRQDSGLLQVLRRVVISSQQILFMNLPVGYFMYGVTVTISHWSDVVAHIPSFRWHRSDWIRRVEWRLRDCCRVVYAL